MLSKKNPLLTIAVPTYNRAPFLNEALERLLQQINATQHEVELIVSNNCSTDNTEGVVLSYVNAGNNITYVRNEENLGMDGNFVQCFRMAKGKYVWVLGDDDFLLDGVLDRLLSVLATDDTYGLVHLSVPRFGGNKVITYSDSNKFICDISFWITLISGNIVNTKYVPLINFEKYMGTFFTLIPLYYTAAYKESKNILVTHRIFDGGKDSNTNGGYNYFEVFFKNYLGIVKEFSPLFKMTWLQYEREKFRLFWDHARYYTLGLLIKKSFPNMKKNKAWSYLFRYFWYEPYFYIFIMLLPAYWLKYKYEKKFK